MNSEQPRIPILSIIVVRYEIRIQKLKNLEDGKALRYLGE